MENLEIAKNFGKFLSKLGQNVEIVDVKAKTQIAEYFVLVTAEDSTNAKEIFKKIEIYSKDNSIEIVGQDGAFQGNWIVVDCGKIVIHIFTPATRQKFNLEKLWKTGKNEIEV